MEVCVMMMMMIIIIIIFCMRRVLEKTQEYNWAVRPVFTDFEKVCNSVRRGVLYN